MGNLKKKQAVVFVLNFISRGAVRKLCNARWGGENIERQRSQVRLDFRHVEEKARENLVKN